MPEIADLNALLDKKHAGKGVRVVKLVEVEVEKEAVVYECAVSGLG